MGILTYGMLYPPYNAIIKHTPSQSITKVSEGWNFGIIDAVNYANIKTDIGSSVLFKQSGAILVTAGGTDYYLVDENNIIFKENELL